MNNEQYVVLRIGKEKYGVDILKVSGIVEYTECTKIPNTTEFFEGVINIRGSIIPLLNLCKILGKESKVDKKSRVLLYKRGESEIGFLVDEANEIVTLNSDELEEPTEILSSGKSTYLQSIGKNNGDLILILEIDKIIETINLQGECHE